MRNKPYLVWALALALVLSSVPAAASPTQPPCFPLEDGSCIPAPQQGQPTVQARQTQPKAPGILVKRKAHVEPAAFRQALAHRTGKQPRALTVPGWWRVEIPDVSAAAETLTALMAMPEVEYAEEDGQVEALRTPNDPYFSYQWGPRKIGAPTAWDYTTGDPGVWVAVIDTGIDYYHPDTPGDLWLGYDFANNDPDPYDDHGHGTHVAGIAAANTNNGVGIAGLCWNCEVLAVKVLSMNGFGYDSDIADGIAYAAFWAYQYGKRTVINLSLGGGYSQAEADAVSYAQSLGALVVAAAGNEHGAPPDYPAALPGVLRVSATNSSDGIADFSNEAPGGVGAPGVDILSTVPTWAGYYDSWSGTSMAAPHAAGAAALVWSAYPSCSSEEVRDELLNTVDVPSGWNSNYGYGRLNLPKAILKVTTDSVPGAMLGVPYTFSLAATGGTPAYSWSLAAGTLPPGLTLSTDGTISGTPSAGGSFNFTVRVSDSLCEESYASFTINVGTIEISAQRWQVAPDNRHLTVQATITNTGSPAFQDVWLMVFQQGDDSGPKAGWQLSTLGPYQSITVQKTYTSSYPLTGNCYYLGLYAANGEESIQLVDDTTFCPQVDLSAQWADLFYRPNSSGTGTLTARLKLQLDGNPAGNTAVTFYVTPDGSRESAVVSKTISLRNFARTRTLQASFRGNFTGYRVRAEIDSLGQVPETDEGNNTVVSLPWDHRDLTGQWLQYSCTPYASYEMVRGKLRLAVEGWDPLVAFTVTVGVGPSSDLSTAVVTRTLKITSLRGYKDVSVSLRANGTTSCTGYLTAQIDTYNNVPEDNESNNQVSVTLR